MKLFGPSRAKMPATRPSPSPSAAPSPAPGPLTAASKPLYVVSGAGAPNYGEELITRAWLDYLAQRHPEREVWLDCPHPGRAAHLFRSTHPRLRTTDTFWELVRGGEGLDDEAAEDRIARLVRELGSPWFDNGLILLRKVSSIHLIGGSHLADHPGIVAAAAAVHEAFGVRVIATGVDLPDALGSFAEVEPADTALDDAYLALALKRPLFDRRPTCDRVILIEGDRPEWDDATITATIDGFASGIAPSSVAFVEALAPEDHRFRGVARPEARFHPFGELWADGLPARAGQRWVASRAHAHLLAAAAGAMGFVVIGDGAEDDAANRRLLEQGTGWVPIAPGEVVRSDDASMNPSFPEKAKQFGARKRALADRLYPV